ncbi:MAG: hypothetical protein ACFFDW_05850 [Candidatus Thorarchaeota archaeon]
MMKNAIHNRFTILLFTSLLIITVISSNNIRPVHAATQTEAFQAITIAYEKIREASLEGAAVNELIDTLNQAIQDYNEGKFNSAYDIANQVIEDAEDLLSSLRWGNVFPYILIPINIILIAAIIVFFGRNILGWFRNRRDEEYMDLEIDYDSIQKQLATNSSVTKKAGEKHEQ